jgi:hypothetical protein
VLAVLLNIFHWVGYPAVLLPVIAHSVEHLTRAWLLIKAGSVALEKRCNDKRRQTALEIVKVLHPEREPWYRAILPWRRPDDHQP